MALITWLGSIIFFSFIGAPSLFKALPLETASKAVSAIFPKYYPLGITCGFILLATLIWSTAKTGVWAPLKILVVLLMLTLTIYNTLVTYPRTKSLKAEMGEITERTDMVHLKAEFDRAHRLSVINNSLVLLLGLILVVLTARGLIL